MITFRSRARRCAFRFCNRIKKEGCASERALAKDFALYDNQYGAATMKTAIRWAGSKKALLPELRRHWVGQTSRYIEPFCGSACLFFEVEPQDAILSDINKELITTYRAIRAQPSKVIECLSRFPITEAHYYKTRLVDPCTLSDIEVAARFLFLNRLCFNGIYRTNLKGHFNVPFGLPKSTVKFDFDTILTMSALLSRASLLHSDFEVVLGEAESGDFVYLDPPYAVAKRRVFAEYHPDSFTIEDIKRLRAALADLDRRGVHFVVSYADSAEGRLLVAGWDYRRVSTRRNVAGFAGHRRTAYELMASNRNLTNG
jgi:DNA adenine methylase